MEKFIKYERFQKYVNGDTEIQKFFDDIVSGGWEIVHYEEKIKNVTTMEIIIVGGKKQSNIL